ncbi:hypothetical protein BG004_003526 [Podila humilis]|nr:hypothetical protein BG004_003526 [Podila humilis]
MDQNALFPTSLLSTSIFQKSKRPHTPSANPNTKSATPIHVPQTQFTPADTPAAGVHHVKQEPKELAHSEQQQQQQYPAPSSSIDDHPEHAANNHMSLVVKTGPTAAAAKDSHSNHHHHNHHHQEQSPSSARSGDRDREINYDSYRYRDYHDRHPDDLSSNSRSRGPSRPPFPARRSSSDYYWDARDHHQQPRDPRVPRDPRDPRDPPRDPRDQRGGGYPDQQYYYNDDRGDRSGRSYSDRVYHYRGNMDDRHQYDNNIGYGSGRGRPNDDDDGPTTTSFKRRKDSISPEPRKKTIAGGVGGGTSNSRLDDGMAKLISSSSAMDISTGSDSQERHQASLDNPNNNNKRHEMASGGRRYMDIQLDHPKQTTLTTMMRGENGKAHPTTSMMDMDRSGSTKQPIVAGHHQSRKTGKRSGSTITTTKMRKEKEKKQKSYNHDSSSGGASSSSSSSGSSSSSSSSDSDSESEDSSGNDDHRGRSSRLKVHGEIHDLILELERTRAKHAKYSDKAKIASKRIRDVSRKLEHRFRDLSDMTDMNGVGGGTGGELQVPPVSSSSRAVVTAAPTRSLVHMEVSNTVPSRSTVAAAAGAKAGGTGVSSNGNINGSGSTKRSSDQQTKQRQQQQQAVMAIGTSKVVDPHQYPTGCP